MRHIRSVQSRLVQIDESVDYQVPKWPGTRASRDDTAVVMVLCIRIYTRSNNSKRPSEQSNARILD